MYYNRTIRILPVKWIIMDHDPPIMKLRKFISQMILQRMLFPYSPKSYGIGRVSYFVSVLDESSDNENYIFGLNEILQNQNYLDKYTVDDLRCIVEVAVNNGILKPWDLADINDYYKCLKSAAQPVNPPTGENIVYSSYEEYLVKELRSERKRSKTNADKLSEWESHGNFDFTKGDLEFGRNEVEGEGRNHISKVRKQMVPTPLKDLRGDVVAEEDTVDFKLSRAKAELAAFVSEKDDLESKGGNDAETRGRLEELDRMIVETRDRVALFEGPSNRHNLCIFGGLQPFNVDGGMRASDLDKFGGVPEPSTSVGGKFMSPTYMDKFGGVPEPSTSVGGKFLSSSYLDKFGGAPNVVGDEVTSAIDLSNLGVPEQATSVREQNQSADDLRNFEVQEDADYRED